MTPQERQLVDDLFDRLSKLESAPRDPDAVAAISQGLRRAPNAIYALVQTVLLQDEALKRANAHIQELESAERPSRISPAASSIRCATHCSDKIKVSRTARCRMCGPRKPAARSGTAVRCCRSRVQYNQPSYGQPPYGQPYGAPQAPMGGGGSFLGTAAAAAAGVVGGSLLLGSIRSMMGGGHQSFGDAGGLGGASRSPWSSDQSDSDLARDAGINDIGSGGSSRRQFARRLVRPGVE